MIKGEIVEKWFVRINDFNSREFDTEREARRFAEENNIDIS